MFKKRVGYLSGLALSLFVIACTVSAGGGDGSGGGRNVNPMALKRAPESGYVLRKVELPDYSGLEASQKTGRHASTEHSYSGEPATNEPVARTEKEKPPRPAIMTATQTVTGNRVSVQDKSSSIKKSSTRPVQRVSFVDTSPTGREEKDRQPQSEEMRTTALLEKARQHRQKAKPQVSAPNRPKAAEKIRAASSRQQSVAAAQQEQLEATQVETEEQAAAKEKKLNWMRMMAQKRAIEREQIRIRRASQPWVEADDHKFLIGSKNYFSAEKEYISEVVFHDLMDPDDKDGLKMISFGSVNVLKPVVQKREERDKRISFDYALSEAESDLYRDNIQDVLRFHSGRPDEREQIDDFFHRSLLEDEPVLGDIVHQIEEYRQSGAFKGLGGEVFVTVWLDDNGLYTEFSEQELKKAFKRWPHYRAINEMVFRTDLYDAIADEVHKIANTPGFGRSVEDRNRAFRTIVLDARKEKIVELYRQGWKLKTSPIFRDYKKSTILVKTSNLEYQTEFTARELGISESSLAEENTAIAANYEADVEDDVSEYDSENSEEREDDASRSL